MIKKSKIWLSVLVGVFIVGTTVIASTLTSCSNTNQTNDNSRPQLTPPTTPQPPKPSPIIKLDTSDVDTKINYLINSNGPGQILNAHNDAIKGGTSMDKINNNIGFASKSTYKMGITASGSPRIYLNIKSSQYPFFQVKLPTQVDQLFKLDSLNSKGYPIDSKITWIIDPSTKADMRILNDNILYNAIAFNGTKLNFNLVAKINSTKKPCEINISVQLNEQPKP